MTLLPVFTPNSITCVYTKLDIMLKTSELLKARLEDNWTYGKMVSQSRSSQETLR